ncbi:hypothetical protein KEM52_005464 [Ascosphaera acerosa]|nr:hypothetical protein KEM52_005464 [Ascosphaera acerosa]
MMGPGSRSRLSAALRAVASASALALLVSRPASASITAVGSKFFAADGTQWFIKGVAYQLSPADPLLNADQCAVDAALMHELGANAIRVYHVDADADAGPDPALARRHDACMAAFARYGIHVFVDLDTFDTAVDQARPQWTARQFARYAAAMDAFARYDNTAGFFVGNEVVNTAAGARAAPYVLAAALDLKRYRDARGYRRIPVGYSAADIAQLRPMLQNYLVCHNEGSNGSSTDESIDFFALNSYEWCGDNTYQGSGYAALQQQAADYPVPIWFSEVGCNAVRPRTFQELAAILAPPMADTWSGAMAYEWLQEANDYGLVTYAQPPGRDRDDNRASVPTPIHPDFHELQARFAALNPTGVARSAYEAQLASAGEAARPPCPSPAAGGWDLDPAAPIPTLGLEVLGIRPTIIHASPSPSPSSLPLPVPAPERTATALPSRTAATATTQTPSPAPITVVSSATPDTQASREVTSTGGTPTGHVSSLTGSATPPPTPTSLQPAVSLNPCLPPPLSAAVAPSLTRLPTLADYL